MINSTGIVNKKVIIKCDLNGNVCEVYFSINEAAIKNGIQPLLIKKNAIGEYEKEGNNFWIYSFENQQVQEEYLDALITTRKNNGFPIEIVKSVGENINKIRGIKLWGRTTSSVLGNNMISEKESTVCGRDNTEITSKQIERNYINEMIDANGERNNREKLDTTCEVDIIEVEKIPDNSVKKEDMTVSQKVTSLFKYIYELISYVFTYFHIWFPDMPCYQFYIILAVSTL